MTERLCAQVALEWWRADGSRTLDRLSNLCASIHERYPGLDLPLIEELARAGTRSWEITRS